MHLGIRIKGVFVDPTPYLLGTKAITPYEEIRMNRPPLPMLTVIVPELFYRDKPNGSRIKYLEKRSYPYIGKSQLLGGYEWAEILLDDGSHVFCGINSKWNTVKFIEPTTITIDKIIYKPLTVALEQDGMLINLSFVPKEK
jgi:hypothetical protein